MSINQNNMLWLIAITMTVFAVGECVSGISDSVSDEISEDTQHHKMHHFKEYESAPLFDPQNNILHLKASRLLDESTSSSLSSSSPLLLSSLDLSSSRQKRSDIKENICDGECGCVPENKFITVNCDLYKNREYIFGSKKYIPKQATSLLIKLNSDAKLRIEQDFFYENKLNRIVIEGTPNGSEHVEIRTNAMKGNNAPFPDIQILNCHTVILRPNAFSGEFKFNASNCHDVVIFPSAFYNTSIYGNFNDIQDLRIHEQAFHNAIAKLNIVSSKIDNLYRFEASLREISFLNCTIGSINAGTFDVISINSIVFESCKIDIFKTRAITEKLFSEHLAITGVTIGTIESEAIAGSGISEFILSNNEIDTIQMHAIHVTAINATIVNNRIIHAGWEWLRVQDWTNITVSRNKFRDFDLISLDRTSNPVQCLFEGNFITNPAKGSLNFTNRFCIILETSFYQNCSCDMNWLLDLSSRDLRSESYCTVDDTLKYCFNATIFNVLKYESEICDYSEPKLDCMKNKNLKKIEGEFLKPEDPDATARSKRNKLVYILAGVGILLVIVTIVLILVYKFVKQRPSTIPISDVGTAAGPAVNGTTLKELKTFSNDDRVIINQTLEIMKQKYLPEVYEQVYENTQILLRGNITEMQRVKTIGDIVQILGECQNSGEDFVAFTDILYKHLAPTAGNSGDPVYAEPNLPGPNNLMMMMNHETDLGEGQTNVDHIYAEPHSVQQPLLTNEYASPADRNEIAALYTEPIINDRENKKNIIPPYAVISPKEHHLIMSNNPDDYTSSQQQPSTSKNLPDVLNPSSKPMTNVQKLAQNFANDPHFHITRSPNTNRKIPKYTVPNLRGKTAADSNGHCDAGINSGGGASNYPTASDARSDHSGGSDITIKIDDIIEYADA